MSPLLKLKRMNVILKTKHWQVFIILILGMTVGNIEVSSDQTISALFSVLGMIIYSYYPLAIGILLQDYLPAKMKLPLYLFIFNCFVWFISYSVTMILTDGEGTTVTGIATIPFLYVFYAFIHFFSFPAKTLKSLEIGKRAKIGDYIGDFFLVIFLPIGIWFLQPRVNKITEIRDKQ